MYSYLNATSDTVDEVDPMRFEPCRWEFCVSMDAAKTVGSTFAYYCFTLILRPRPRRDSVKRWNWNFFSPHDSFIGPRLVVTLSNKNRLEN